MENDNVQLIRHTKGVVAMGTRDQMYAMVKHHIDDDLFLIHDPESKDALVLIREDGVVYPVQQYPILPDMTTEEMLASAYSIRDELLQAAMENLKDEVKALSETV